MANISFRIDDEKRETVDKRAEESNLSRAGYIRDALEVRDEYYTLRDKHASLQDEYSQLQAEHETLQREHKQAQNELSDAKQEVERLKNEKRLILEDREERQELQRYVENELTWHEQSLPTRLKWWIFGKQSD